MEMVLSDYSTGHAVSEEGDECRLPADFFVQGTDVGICGHRHNMCLLNVLYFFCSQNLDDIAFCKPVP